MASPREVIYTALRKYDPNMKLRDKQEECLTYIVENSDHGCNLIVSLPTGYGKSLIYCLLPQVLKDHQRKDNGCVLVVCPLNLIQYDQMRNLAAHGIASCRLSQDCKATTLVNNVENEVTLTDVMAAKFDLIFCHPEALFNTTDGETLLYSQPFQEKLLAVVVDECHTVEAW